MEEKSDIIIQLVFFFLMGFGFWVLIINCNKLTLNKNSMLVIFKKMSVDLILKYFNFYCLLY